MLDSEDVLRNVMNRHKFSEAMLKFLEFRENAIQIILMDHMRPEAHRADRVSSIGIDYLKLVWTMMGRSSTV